jgi:uncharacterized damage-inducible protein DinB
MSLTDNYRFLARYNRWFNARLYDACGQLTDSARRQDCGAFFGSIHGTLNHILWGDAMWLGRFAAQDGPLGGDCLPPVLLALPVGAAHGTELHADWVNLRSHRSALDEAIENWSAGFDEACVQQKMVYRNTRGVERRHPAWQALTHFFNHQTHHRGQVTTLLMQAGVDVGVTDLIALV